MTDFDFHSVLNFQHLQQKITNSKYTHARTHAHTHTREHVLYTVIAQCI